MNRAKETIQRVLFPSVHAETFGKCIETTESQRQDQSPDLYHTFFNPFQKFPSFEVQPGFQCFESEDSPSPPRKNEDIIDQTH
jgi:hypothetical protein